MNRKIIGLNVRKTLKSLLSFSLKKRYLLALLCLVSSFGFALDPSTSGKKSGVAGAKLERQQSSKKLIDDIKSYQDFRNTWHEYQKNPSKENRKQLADELGVSTKSMVSDREFMGEHKESLNRALGSMVNLSEKDDFTQFASKFQDSLPKNGKNIGAGLADALTNNNLAEAKKIISRAIDALSDEQKIDLVISVITNGGSALEESIQVELFSEFLGVQAIEKAEQRKKDICNTLSLKLDDHNEHIKDVANAWVFENDAPLNENAAYEKLLSNLSGLTSEAYDQVMHDLKAAPQYAATEQVVLRNQTVLSNAVLDNVKGGQQVWLSPVPVFRYKQNTELGQITGFDATTYGIGVGFISGTENAGLGLQGAWMHSDIEFDNDRGTAKLDGFHLGPVFHYSEGPWFFNALVDVARTSCDGSRHLIIDNETDLAIDQTYTYNPIIWSADFGLATGYKFYLSRAEDLALIPAFKFNFARMWQSKFTEKSEKENSDKDYAYDVKGKHYTQLALRPEVKVVKDFNLDSLRFSPAIRIGWLTYIPLGSSGKYSVQHLGLNQADSSDADQNNPWLTYQAFNKTTHRLVLGAETEIATKGNFATTLNYEAQLEKKAEDHDKRNNLQTFLVNLNWKF
ncbi:MAG: autotransporter outer membrane beta-barrel domain-containing protein [Chlamydiota bacterium]